MQQRRCDGGDAGSFVPVSRMIGVIINKESKISYSLIPEWRPPLRPFLSFFNLLPFVNNKQKKYLKVWGTTTSGRSYDYYLVVAASRYLAPELERAQEPRNLCTLRLLPKLNERLFLVIDINLIQNIHTL